MKRKQYMWVAVINDIFGYGLTVIGKSEEIVMKSIKKEFYVSKRNRMKYDREWHHYYRDRISTFKSAWEDWGGRCKKIELGKVYDDGFNN